MPTIYDVAEKAGVSVATVSRVINKTGNVRPSTYRKVKDAIEALNYTPNDVARTLSTKQSRMIGLIIPDITNPFYPAVARGVQDTCQASGYNVLMCNTDENPALFEEYVLGLYNRQVDGLIAQAFWPNDLSILEDIKESGIHTVLLSDPNKVDISAVYSDETSGSYAATRHLIDIGHERIAFFGGCQSSDITQRRYEGYRHALADAGIVQEEQYVLFSSFNQTGGAQMAKQLLRLSDRPTAVFAANDLIAIGAIRHFELCEITIPEQLAIVGFDDIDLGRCIRPRLTTIANPKYELGQTAAQLLLSGITGSEEPCRRILLRTRLVIRESTLMTSTIQSDGNNAIA